MIKPMPGFITHFRGPPVPIPPPRVVHCCKEKYDVLIDRRTPWGNKYKIGRDGTREQVIAKFADSLSDRMKKRIKRHLRGKVLGCWCAPQPCHGDVLLRIANE